MGIRPWGSIPPTRAGCQQRPRRLDHLLAGHPGETQSEMYTFATGRENRPRSQHIWPPDLLAMGLLGRRGRSAIVFENLETGQQVSLPMRYAPSTVAFSGTSYVYNDSDYSQVTLMPSILAQPITSYVIEDPTDGWEYVDEIPMMNDRLITWVGPNAWLVFDRKLQRPVKIAIGANGSMALSAAIIWWQHPHSRRRTWMPSIRDCPIIM